MDGSGGDSGHGGGRVMGRLVGPSGSGVDHGYGVAASMIGTAIASSRSPEDAVYTVPPPPPPPPPPPGTAVRRKKYGDVLFVQDDDFLFLVVPSNVVQSLGPARAPAVCSAFSVWVSAPLVHVDCHVDQSDPRVLHVVVRAWGDVPHMAPLHAPEYPHPHQAAGRGTAVRARPTLPSLLRPRTHARGALWRVSVMLDSEYSCSLAAQHIDARRDALLDQRQALFRRALAPSTGADGGAADSGEVAASGETEVAGEGTAVE
jgi:hypothetical protein